MAVLPNINQQNQGLRPQLPNIPGPQQGAATIQSQLTPALGGRSIDNMAPDNGQWGGAPRYMTPNSGALGNSVNRTNNPYSNVASISPFGGTFSQAAYNQQQNMMARGQARLPSLSMQMPTQPSMGALNTAYYGASGGIRPQDQGMAPMGGGTQGFESPTDVGNARIVDEMGSDNASNENLFPTNPPGDVRMGGNNEYLFPTNPPPPGGVKPPQDESTQPVYDLSVFNNPNPPTPKNPNLPPLEQMLLNRWTNPDARLGAHPLAGQLLPAPAQSPVDDYKSPPSTNPPAPGTGGMI